MRCNNGISLGGFSCFQLESGLGSAVGVEGSRDLESKHLRVAAGLEPSGYRV